MTLTHIFRLLFPLRHRVATDEYSCDVRDVQYITYIHSGGVETGEWITKWEMRRCGDEV